LPQSPPLDLPANAHTLKTVKITTNPQDIRVFARSVGRTTVFVRSKRPLDFTAFMSVIVPAEVGVFFHFLDGPKGIKTNRTVGELDGIVATMNGMYRRNRAGVIFKRSGENAKLVVPGLGLTQISGVKLHGHGGPDFDAIAKNEKPGILFDVFFVNTLVDLSDPMNPEVNNLLAITTRPPNDTKPLRCCICRDASPSDPAGITVGKTLAHEAGHALGEDDDFKDTNSLMFFKQSGATDTRIDDAMADRMLASFRSFPP
jgi:hypothetical protein